HLQAVMAWVPTNPCDEIWVDRRKSSRRDNATKKAGTVVPAQLEKPGRSGRKIRLDFQKTLRCIPERILHSWNFSDRSAFDGREHSVTPRPVLSVGFGRICCPRGGLRIAGSFLVGMAPAAARATLTALLVFLSRPAALVPRCAGMSIAALVGLAAGFL